MYPIRTRGPERRKIEAGPPKGCAERRKRAERRLPLANEAEISDDDFVKLFGAVTKFGNTDQRFDLASQVFERVRDQ